MYAAFFGFRDHPFDLTPNPRFLVLTEAHQEALSNLEYGISSRRGITALIGEAGTGKTTLIRTALDRQPKHVHCVYLNNPALTRDEFVELLASRFRLTPEASKSKAALLTELEAALRRRHEAGETTALIVDEAQSLPLDLLEEIRLLGNIETDDAKLLAIVLAGQPELGTRLNDESLRQLKQRVALRCELRPLTQAETAAYIAGRIRAAGGVGAQAFTREAVMLIHERASGIPRTVSVIADNALLAGFALRVKPVNSAIVTEVCEDLDLPAAPVAETASSAQPAARQDRAEDASPRIMAFETSSSQDVAKEETTEPAAEVAISGGARSDAALFTSMYPKRRRFSIFRGQ